MPAIAVNPPFPLFTDADGQPLDDAYIYIGTANQNPVSNPITVYWDSALTIPSAQPIRTSGGYPVYNGSPSRFYAASAYSILVRDKNGSFIYTAPNENLFQSSEIVFTQAGVGAVARTAQNKMREIVSVKDFGAVGDGVTDDTAEIQLALNSGAFGIYFPDGNYLCGGLTVPAAVQKIYGEGRLLANANNVTVLQVLTDVSRQRTKTIEGLRVNGNSFTGVTGIKFGSTTNNPSPGAQEAVLYVAMRDVLVRACETGIDSRVSMEHSFQNIVCAFNTVGMKLYGDAINGGGNANGFDGLRLQSNTIGMMLVCSANFPIVNNMFTNMTVQENTLCGIYVRGFGIAGPVEACVFDVAHFEGNAGGGAGSLVVDGYTVVRADIHITNYAAVILRASNIASNANPFSQVDTYSTFHVYDTNGYGQQAGVLFATDPTSYVFENGICIGTGIKYVQSYGEFSSPGPGVCTTIGFPLLQYAKVSNSVVSVSTPEAPQITNAVGAGVTVSHDKDAVFGLVSTITFAASPGSTATNKFHWYGGAGTSGNHFLMSVLAKSSADSYIRFNSWRDLSYMNVRQLMKAGEWKRIVIVGRLNSTTGLQLYVYPDDSVGATLSFKALQYISTPNLNEINAIYRNGFVGNATFEDRRSAAPTVGTWNQNDRIWNASPSAGGTPGWVCVASGTPGTWKAMANLAA